MPEGRRPSLGETYSEFSAVVHAQEHLLQDDEELFFEDIATTSNENYPQHHHSAWQDVKQEGRLFLELALPTCLLSVGTNISPFLTASVIGLKFGQTYLSAFTLANLTGNLFTFSLLWGLFTAADTLSPQAFGKGEYREVGYQLIRGIVLASLLALPMNGILVIYLEPLLIHIGEDPEAAALAAAWYRIFVLAMPFVILFAALWKFLSAQHVMMPLMVVSLVSCGVVLPIALELMTNAFGFLGSAMAYVTFQVTQTCLLLIYLYWKRPFVAETWPGLSWNYLLNALQWKYLLEYLNLGGGGMLAQSEWVFWEALGLIIGQLGVLELSTHTIPNQMIMLACLAPFAFGTALAIRMGITLSSLKHHHRNTPTSTNDDVDKNDNNNTNPQPRTAVDAVSKTKTMVTAIVTASAVFFGLCTIWMYVYQDWIYSFFTTEADVIEMAHRIWWKVCLFSWNVVFFALFSGVSTGLGLQWSLGAVNFVFLWLFGVPVTYHATIVRKGGLEAAWTWINVPYLLMNVTLLGIFMTTDWYQIQDKILAGEIVQDPERKEEHRHYDEARTNSEKTGLLECNGSGHENGNLVTKIYNGTDEFNA